LAGPLPADREEANVDKAKRIGHLAGASHPHMAGLAVTSQRSTMAADFELGIDMLLAGIAACAT
jgi:hypothetical protein